MIKKQQLLDFITHEVNKGDTIICLQRERGKTKEEEHSYVFVNKESGIKHFQDDYDDTLISRVHNLEIIEWRLK